MNRLDLLARYAAGLPKAKSDAGADTLDAASLEDAVWPHLLEATQLRKVYVAESALTALGEVAVTEPRREEAKRLLLDALGHRNHLLGRCAALGLIRVADEATMKAMSEAAASESTSSDVRALIALTLAEHGYSPATKLLYDLAASSDDGRDSDELVGAAIAGLGFYPGDDPARSVSWLARLAFDDEKAAEAQRALAVEALGRASNAELVKAPLLRALDDSSAQVRRAAVVALGVLDYRAAGWNAGTLAAVVRKIEARLVDAMNLDADALARRLAAISVGRIHAQGAPVKAGIRALKRHVAADGPGLREFALLALAIAGESSVIELATEAIRSENPSTRSAALIALGIGELRARATGRTDARPRAPHLVQGVHQGDRNPHVRAYASLALGMIAAPGAARRIRDSFNDGSTAEELAYGIFGLALTGEPDVASEIVEFLHPDHMRNGFIASHAIYALGLTKDRSASTFEALIKKANDDSDMYVQSAALSAIGYLAKPERFAQRHRIGAGHTFTVRYDYLSVYFYML